MKRKEREEAIKLRKDGFTYKEILKIQIHKPEDIDKAHEFWSLVTEIPIHQFTKAYVKTTPTSQKKVGSLLDNGICHIRISDIHLLTGIKGWIKGISGAIV